DNDGTLWVEQPLYTQGFFVIDEIRRLAAEHPEWSHEEPFAAVLSGDISRLATLSEHDVAVLLAATHAGMTTTAFADAARVWLETARHPRFDRVFTQCVYQPQLELLSFLRANGFTVFIVSGGGVDFLRQFAEETYGIPPHQVIGSSVQASFSIVDGEPVLTKEAVVGSIDDQAGKPINIHLHIGRQPILAFGNSDGDLPMLQYTDAGSGPRLALIVHHDDAAREYAYDRSSAVGCLDAAWDEALARGWTVVSMKRDWRTVFAE
ncbi:MAG: haloacid dehalogenase-like hydrolase, partial [Thermomicrobiales bacterium]|nr:haloacid dehalogenase-like hydrolase [Thermomicrobiales bacterium]